MLRPNVRILIKEKSAYEIINMVEKFIASKPKTEYFLANIDLLRLYGRVQNREKFYELAFYLSANIKNSAIYREVARFAYFMDCNSARAKIYARKAILENKNEPLWVYYIARLPKTYYEEIYDGIFLTAIPKNASTSLKTMMLEKVHGKNDLNPHSVFGNPFFNTNDNHALVTENDLKLLSIREPISRFVSYFNKNIIEESSLHEELNYPDKEIEYSLKLKPDLEYFVSNLNKYCYVFNDVLHHILPQTAYFDSLENYDCVADIKESYLLGVAIAKKLNFETAITPPKKMVSKNKIDNIEMNDQTKSSLIKIFDDDIRMYKKDYIGISYSFNFDSNMSELE